MKTREAHVPDRSLAIAIDVVAKELKRQQATIDDRTSPRWAVEHARYEAYGMRHALAAISGVLGYSPTPMPESPANQPALRAIEWSRRVLEEE